jgi:hypothetical protein
MLQDPKKMQRCVDSILKQICYNTLNRTYGQVREDSRQRVQVSRGVVVTGHQENQNLAPVQHKTNLRIVLIISTELWSKASKF